jgi:RimJ/RimL family protein N-acetyltransferase
MPAISDAWPTLETPRLRLRRFREADLPLFMAYRNDPEVARYQGWDSISLPEAQAFIEEQRRIQPGVPGVGMQIAIEWKATGLLVGDCYFCVQADDSEQAELGYTLATAAQGRGLATEAVAAWLAYAFDAYHLHRVTALLDVENHRSAALLERLGFRREGHFLRSAWFKGKWCDEYLYAILREEWQARPGAG